MRSESLSGDASSVRKFEIGRQRFLLLLVFSWSCSKGVQDFSVRNQGTRAPVTADPADGSSDDGKPIRTVKAPILQIAKNTEHLTSEFLDNVSLVSKISPDQIMIFGKNGRSWIYGKDELVPQVLEATVFKPDGSQLFTLPEGDFWVVSSTEIGRKKSGSVEQGRVTIERFDIGTLEGVKANIKVLYVSPLEIILHLETHLALLSIQDGKLSSNQVVINKFPFPLGGPIQAAGRAINGSFWIAYRDFLALLEPKEAVFSWSKVRIQMGQHLDYTQLGLWLDQTNNDLVGDVLALQEGKFWSVSGAPIVAKSP